MKARENSVWKGHVGATRLPVGEIPSITSCSEVQNGVL